MKQYHPIQLQILKKLLFSPSLRYKNLKPSPDTESNQLNFHLDQMIKEGFIEKTASRYTLTNPGKEFANRLNTQNATIQKQAKISVIIIPVKKLATKKYYLIYTRLKHPFYGCQGFMSGKVNFGEKVIESAKRELEEETGLKGSPKIIALKHYRVWSIDKNNLLEDKFMFFCKVLNPKGRITQSDEGKYEWVEKGGLKEYVVNHFESFDVLLEDIRLAENKSKNMIFQEIDHLSGSF